MAVTASLVKEVRERTGAGMMECKNALVESNGDIDAAIEVLRIQGQAKADKKASRIASEGVLALRTDASQTAGVIVELNCETDFVAKKADFHAFADEIAALVLAHQPSDVEALGALRVDDGGETVDERRRALVARIGENITLRRFARLDAGDGHLGRYVHLGGRIAVLVAVSGGSEELGKDIAMHVSWFRPLCIGEADVPAETLDKEKSILRAQAAESGKPPEIVEKMVAGRLKKFLKEITLLGQPFVKDNDVSVQKYLAAGGARVTGFVRLEVGEGMEKKSANFADEVMTQVKRAR